MREQSETVADEGIRQWFEKAAVVLGVVASCITILTFALHLANLIVLSATALALFAIAAVLIWVGLGISKLAEAVRELRKVRRGVIEIRDSQVNVAESINNAVQGIRDSQVNFARDVGQIIQGLKSDMKVTKSGPTSNEDQ